MTHPLAGQTAIVTGSGRGIGRAIALAYARAGAAVTVTARSTDQITSVAAEIESAGGRAIAVPADITDRAAVEHLVAATEELLGPVDILVNNAATLEGVPFNGPTWDADPSAWWRMVEVDLWGPVLCSYLVLPGMAARRRGRIINVASVAVVNGMGRASAYGVAKTALTRFSESIANEARPYGIGVYVMEPGAVRTQMVDDAIAAGSEGLRRVFAGGLETGEGPAVDLALGLATEDILDLTGRFFSVYDDLAEKRRRSAEILDQDLYTLRLNALDGWPVAGWSTK